MLLDTLNFLRVPVLFLSPILFLAVVGLIWSPAAGAISAWLAHREGMPAVRAFGGGAVASIALFLPWCFLTANFLRWRLSDRLIERVYWLILILWLICPLVIFAIFYGFVVAFAIILSLWADRGDVLSLSVLFGMIGAVVVLAQSFMWNRARRWVSRAEVGNNIYLQGRVTALPRRHFGPFVGALIWSIAAPALLVSSVYVLFAAS